MESHSRSDQKGRISQMLMAVVLSVVLVATACGGLPSGGDRQSAGSSPAKGEPKGGGNLVFASSFAKDSLDIVGDGAYPISRAGSIEPLVDSTIEGTVSPRLAEKWSRTNDTTWEFTLRRGGKFHDGTPINAKAAAVSLNYVANAASVPRGIKGIGLKATAQDEHTLVVTTTKPDPILPLRLSAPSTAILSEKAFATNPMTPVGFGSGPFKITKVTPGVGISLVRFDEYWDGAPKLATVEVRFVKDSTARFNGLKSGEFQVADAISPSDFLKAKADKDLVAKPVDLPRSTNLSMNTQRGVTSDLRVRQAIDLLIDRDGIAKTVGEGLVKPTGAYFGDTFSWAPKAQARPADAEEQAKKLLDQAGLKAGDPKLDINLLTYSLRPELVDVANVIKSNLDKAGFRVTIEVADYTKVVEPKVVKGDFDLFLGSRSFYTDVPDLAGFLTSDFGCKQAANLNHYCNPELEELIKRLDSVSDRSQRNEIFGKAAKILLDQKVGLPIYTDTSRDVWLAKVNGITTDPVGHYLVTKHTSLAG